MSTPLLEVRNLSKAFKAFRAVDGMELSVEAGTIHSVIGPNGAGKSTLFKLITGVHVPTAGEILLGGQAIGGQRPHQIARKGLVQVFQLTSVFTRLSVFDSVMMAAMATQRRSLDLSGRFRKALAGEIELLLEDVGISHLAKRISGELSHGDQRALELAMALATKPRVLLLDEPTAGMSPAETSTIAALIVSSVRSRDITVVLSEHDMDVIFEISDRVTVMHQGRVIAEGTPQEVRTIPEVMAVYLGDQVSGVVSVGYGPLPRRRESGPRTPLPDSSKHREKGQS